MSDESESEAADESDVTEGSVTEDEQSGLQEGDFVELSYSAFTVEGDDLVDTTSREVAEEEDVEIEDQEFHPRTVVLGEGHIFEAVEDDVVGGEVGDSGTVVVEKPFGEYDEDGVRTVSAEKIPEDDRYPGAHVDVGGEHGHVETIIGGRARVDFNHPLAGEDVEYDYEIEGEVEDRVDKASGLLQMYFDVELDTHIETDEVEEETRTDEGETATETIEKETLYIEQSPQLQFNQQWMMGKQQILDQLIDMLDVDRVIVQEIIDGQAAGMGGMMGGMGGADLGEVEEALDDEDVDAEEIVEELEAEQTEE